MSQIEMDKAIIQRYFDTYNNKNESWEIIPSDYIDHGQSACMGSPGIVTGWLDWLAEMGPEKKQSIL
jgi:hypothetical protein